MEAVANGNNNDDANQQHAVDAAARRDKRTKLTSIVDRQDRFPARQRTKIDELVDAFLDALGHDVHEMLCDVNAGEEYRGLDSDRDTEAEVETAVRFFPNVLSRRGGIYDCYPVISLTFMIDDNNYCVCNIKAVPFVHVLARLAIEFGSFQENERGGLLVDNNGDFLKVLARSSHSSYGEEHNQLVDNVYLGEMIRLRQMGLLRREDIQEYELVLWLCRQSYFAENRFQFLVEWNPAHYYR